MVLINLNFNNFSEANTLKSIFNGLGNEFEYTEKGIFRRKKPPQCPECGNSMNHNGFNGYTKKSLGTISVDNTFLLL